MTFLSELSDLLQVGEIKPFSAKERETLYAAAYGMYEVGDYEKGADLFTHLILHDPFDVRFWKGLAAARQMQKLYLDALKAWAITCHLSGQDPMGHFHAAECYLSLDEIEEAKKALRCAEGLLKNG